MRKSQRILDIEKEYGMEYSEILKKLHDEDKMSIKQIAKKLNCDSGNLSRQFKKLGIKARSNKEAFANWWNSDADKTKFIENAHRSAEIMQTKESRDKLREVMKTQEYKNKMSKANRGKNNGMYRKFVPNTKGMKYNYGKTNAMYNSNITEEHRIKTRGIFGYKKWSKQVRERDNHTCKICGKTKDDVKMMVAHHLDDYDTHEELRLDLNNGITLCGSCHNGFHNKYKGQKTTKEQFYEYLSELHL